MWESDGINQGTPNKYSIGTQAKLLQYFINEKNVPWVALDLAKGWRLISRRFSVVAFEYRPVCMQWQ